jgi:hypothetical protein
MMALLAMGPGGCGSDARADARDSGSDGVGVRPEGEDAPSGGGTGPDAQASPDASAVPAIDAGACDRLAPSGTWENITPPVAMLHDIAPCPYGGEFVMNPLDPSMLYVGTCNEGIWKTTDCGSTWVHVNTGTNGEALDTGRQWTFLIDPVHPEVLYTNSGYNAYVNGGMFDGNGVSGAFRVSGALRTAARTGST